MEFDWGNNLWGLGVALITLLLGSLVIPILLRYYQTRNLLNHLLMELISNRMLLQRYRSVGVKILDEHAWTKTKENELLVSLLLETEHPNVLHKITNAYQFARSRALRDELSEQELLKCQQRFNTAFSVLWHHLESRRVRYWMIPLFSRTRLLKMQRMFRR